MTEILFIAVILTLTAYGVLGILIERGLKKSREVYSRVNSSGRPSVSVVIAVRNEIDNITGVMASLSSQTYDNYEVIIVNDNSTDDTGKIAEEICREKSNFRLIEAPDNRYVWGPKKNALHAGIMASAGEIILTTDADCRPLPEWIESFAGKFVEAGAVVGFSPIRSDQNLFGRLKGLESLASAIVSAGLIGINRAYMATGRNFAYRRSLYLESGGFGEAGKAAAGDDDLLLQRLQKKAPVLFNFDAAAKNESFEGGGGYLARKKRHFSVARKFPALLIAFGGIVISVQLTAVAAVIAGASMNLKLLVGAGILSYLIKIIIDHRILAKGSKLLGEEYRFFDFLIAEVFQIPYSLILQPLSFFGKINWRGRTL